MLASLPLFAARSIAGALTLLLFAQAVLAGQFFAGNSGAMLSHSFLGEAAAWLALLLVFLGGLCVWRGILSRPWMIVFLALFALVGLQVHAGHGGALSLHIPLGAALLAASTTLTVWLMWRKTTSSGALASATPSENPISPDPRPL